MKLCTVAAFTLLSLGVCSAQNARLFWHAFPAGFSGSQMENTSIRAVVGQTFVGMSWNAGTRITSGFFADTLLGARITSLDGQDQLPVSYALAQNFPNPFNPSTTIRFEVPGKSFVTLKVYNVLGQEVATLINEERAAGKYDVRFNATGLASGAYFYRLTAGDFVSVKKLLLLR